MADQFYGTIEVIFVMNFLNFFFYLVAPVKEPFVLVAVRFILVSGAFGRRYD